MKILLISYEGSWHEMYLLTFSTSQFSTDILLLSSSNTISLPPLRQWSECIVMYSVYVYVYMYYVYVVYSDCNREQLFLKDISLIFDLFHLEQQFWAWMLGVESMPSCPYNVTSCPCTFTFPCCACRCFHRYARSSGYQPPPCYRSATRRGGTSKHCSTYYHSRWPQRYCLLPWGSLPPHHSPPQLLVEKIYISLCLCHLFPTHLHITFGWQAPTYPWYILCSALIARERWAGLQER